MIATARALSSSSSTSVPAAAPTAAAEVALPSLYSYLRQVPDPRDPRGRRHSLFAVLGLICLAWICGVHGYLPAHQWARALPLSEVKALGFRKRTPAASTLLLILKLVSWEAVETQLRAWLTAVQEALAAAGYPPHPSTRSPSGALPAVDPQAAAIDGKALRGSWKRGAEEAGLLAVVTHQLALTLAQVPLASKEGELTGVRPLLQQLVLEGLVITVDAQFTQPDLAQTICERGGDYVMRVKANQPGLLADLQDLLSPAGYDRERRRSHSTSDKRHGRVEQRQIVVQALTAEQAQELAWPGARQVFVVISCRVRRGKPPGKPTLLYGITSLGPEAADAERLLRLHRGHWTIENRAFWPRDVAFGEDASPAKASNSVAVLACLRGAVLNLIRLSPGGDRVTRTIRQFNANHASALKALGCPC